MKLETYKLPCHWASYFINGDDSGYDYEEIIAMQAFEDDMIERHGQCWCLSCGEDEDDFRRYHDAARYGVLACNVTDFTFDVTPRRNSK